MSDFTPDPRSCFVALIGDAPYAMFGNLPDHPGQRQTQLHAANLIISGVLTPALDQHREVSALLIGDPENDITVATMIKVFDEDQQDALTRFGVKLNGHTRHYLWSNRDDLPSPDDGSAISIAGL